MSEFKKYIGTWMHSFPEDSDDYLSEYVISGNEEEPVVTARDISDGEFFEVSDVNWNEGKLTFKTLMPSTKRKGKNVFSLNEDGVLESEFTFTVMEQLRRK